MDSSFKPAAESDDRLSGGARRLILTDPPHLDYISQGLADITGYTRADLRELFNDEYVRIVHPDDQAAFLAFDDAMRRGETTLSLEYRIVRKDGTVVHVRDTMNSHAMPDGTMVGYSLVSLADRGVQVADGLADHNAHAADSGAETASDTAQPGGSQPGGLAEDTIPYGLVVFDHVSHEVSFTNRQFWDMLGSHDDNDTLHLRMENDPISLVPAVDQERFRAAMRKALTSGEPVTFETHLWHTDGYLVEVAGWLSFITDAAGERYRLAIVDVTRERSRERESRRKLRVGYFKTIYDVLFLFDVSKQTALCFKYEGNAPFDTDGGIRIMLPDAIDHLVGRLCAEESRETLSAFLEPLRHEAAQAGASDTAASARAAQIGAAQAHAHMRHRLEFTSLLGDAPTDSEAVLIDAEAGAYFFGCRRNPAPAAVADIAPAAGIPEAAGRTGRTPADPAPASTRLIVPTAESGTFAFSLGDNAARVLYSNERGQVFGRNGLKPGFEAPLGAFLAKTPLAEGQLMQLVEGGELALVDTRPDGAELAWRLVRQRSYDGEAVVFAFEVPLWVADAEGAGQLSDELNAQPKVFVKTFGYFDVFVDGRAVVFNSAKSKELLALLVDRRGGFVSANEAISYLWEDEAATPTVLARHRKIAMRMRNTLADYGIEHIVKTTNGQRCLDVDAVKCDLYDYLAGDPNVTFPGTYLQNYSWGEVTLGELLTTMPFH